MMRLAPFLVLSTAIHLAIGIVWSGLFVSSITMVGTAHGAEDTVYCTVISHEEMIAQTAVAAAADALPSTQSENVSQEKEQERDSRETPPSEEQPADLETERRGVDHTPVIAAQSAESSDPVEVGAQEPQTEPHSEHDTARDPVDRTSSQQSAVASAASLPQTASNPSRFRAAKGLDLADFRSRVVSAIREASFFPKEAVQRRQHGEITVAFSIIRDGSVEDLRIVKPSGLKALDDAAVEIVRKASAGFPPFPSAVTQDRLRYVVPIIFTKDTPKKR